MKHKHTPKFESEIRYFIWIGKALLGDGHTPQEALLDAKQRLLQHRRFVVKQEPRKCSNFKIKPFSK